MPNQGIQKEDIENVIGILRNFKITISNMRLYPMESALVQNALQATLDSLNLVLEKYKFLTIAMVEGKIIVNGTDISKGRPEPIHAGIFESKLLEHIIKSVTFRQGINIAELRTFLSLLKEKYNPQSPITKHLQEAGVTKIGIDEKKYAVVGEKDLVIERGQDILAKSKGKLNNLLNAVEHTVDMVFAIDEPTVREKAKLEVAKKLIFKDPGLLEKILEETGGEGGMGYGIDITHMENILGDVVELYRLYKAEKKEEYEKRIRETITRIVNILKKHNPSFQLSADFLQHIGNILEENKKLKQVDISRLDTKYQKRVLTFLEEDNTELLNENEIVDSIKQLVNEGYHQTAFTVIRKIVLNYDSIHPVVRAKAVKLMAKLLPQTFISTSDKEFQYVYLKNIQLILRETDPENLSELSNILPELTDLAIKRGHFKAVMVLLEHLAKLRSDGNISEERRGVYTKLMGKMADKLMDFIIPAVKENDKKDIAIKMLSYLGISAVSHLIDTIKNEKSQEQRHFYATVINALGNKARGMFYAAIDSERNDNKLISMLSVIDDFEQDDNLIEILKRLLVTSTKEIKPYVFKILKDLNTEGLENFAFELTDNDNPELKILGFEYLFEKNPESIKDNVENILIPKKVLFVKLKHAEYLNVKKRLLQLIGDHTQTWGIPLLIHYVKSDDKTFKNTAMNALLHFKPEMLRKYSEEFQRMVHSKDAITMSIGEKLIKHIKAQK